MKGIGLMGCKDSAYGHILPSSCYLSRKLMLRQSNDNVLFFRLKYAVGFLETQSSLLSDASLNAGIFSFRMEQ